jgi:RNA polymerase sigma factor (sigma-70 family)
MNSKPSEPPETPTPTPAPQALAQKDKRSKTRPGSPDSFEPPTQGTPAMSANPKLRSLIRVACLCAGMALGGVLDEVREAEGQTDWEVRYCDEAHACLSQLAANPPHVLILDWQRCLSCSRNCVLALHKSCPNLPLLFIGADPNSPNIPRQAAPSLARCVSPDASPDEVRHAVRELVSRAPKASHANEKQTAEPAPAVPLPEAKPPWQDPVVQEKLRAIVTSLRAPADDEDDLFQEALIHLWKLEKRRPGQKLSWYLRSCYLHLKDSLKAGRSLDSARHRAGRVDPPSGQDGDDGIEALPLWARDDIVSDVCWREKISILMAHLKPREQTILELSLKGHLEEEIAKGVGISQPAVSQAIERIASVAARLDLAD